MIRMRISQGKKRTVTKFDEISTENARNMREFLQNQTIIKRVRTFDEYIHKL